MISSSFNAAQFSQQLVDAERFTKDQLYSNNLSTYQTQLSAYNYIDTNLDTMLDNLEALSSDSFNAKTASITGEEASISVEETAPVGDYELVVSQLATAAQQAKTFTSEDEILPATGVIEIQLGTDPDDAFTIDLAVANAAGDFSVEDLRNAINQHADNSGVQASLVRTGSSVELMLTSQQTGADNTISASLDGADWGFTELRAAQDAQASINGVAITSSTNTLTEVIDGVSLELNQVNDTGDSSMIRIEADTEATTQAVTDFVNSFNALLNQLDVVTGSLGSEASDSSSSSVGVLNGDASLRLLEGRLKNVLFESAPNGIRLADIGVELDRYGKLEIDSDKLEEALVNDPASVEAIFNDSGAYIDQLEAVIEPYTEFNGYLDNRENSLESRIDRVEYDMEQLDIQMQRRYDLYLAQFTAMEATINQFNSASSLFTTQQESN